MSEYDTWSVRYVLEALFGQQCAYSWCQTMSYVCARQLDIGKRRAVRALRRTLLFPTEERWEELSLTSL